MKNEDIDSAQKAIDFAVLYFQRLKEKAGYQVEGGKFYPNYISNEEFAAELELLQKGYPEVYNAYNSGAGDELTESVRYIRGRKVVLPPKMACFGSSSRFVCTEVIGVEGMLFEAALSTEVGGKASLDARKKIASKEMDVFLEAKRREIYASHRNVEISEVYRDVLNHLTPFFTYTAAPARKKRCFLATFKVCEREIVHFDLKQLICHFLAIAAGLLKGEIKSKRIRFVYLIFNPKEVERFIDDNFKAEVFRKHSETLEEVTLFDMEKLFDAIFAYQRRNIPEPLNVEYRFEFCLADQMDRKGLKKLFE